MRRNRTPSFSRERKKLRIVEPMDVGNPPPQLPRAAQAFARRQRPPERAVRLFIALRDLVRFFGGRAPSAHIVPHSTSRRPPAQQRPIMNDLPTRAVLPRVTALYI